MRLRTDEVKVCYLSPERLCIFCQNFTQIL